MSTPSTASIPGMGAYVARYRSALLGMFKPRFLLKAIWRAVSRKLFIYLFIAPFIYALAAAWHIYLQAKAGGWNDAPGELLQPDNYMDAGAKWFAMAMFLFGIYGFARGTGFRIIKTTYGALVAAPGGVVFGFGVFQRNIGESLLYERLLMAGGVVAILGAIVSLVHNPWHVYLLLASAIALLGALKMAKGQKVAAQGRAGVSLARQSWLFVLGISGGLFLSWLHLGFLGIVAIGVGVFLSVRRKHSPKTGGRSGGQAGGAALLLLMLCGFFLTTSALWADDGGWDEYSPQGEEKTIGGYLRTKDGQKVIGLGLVAGGFATSGALLGILLGGALGEAFRDALDSIPPVMVGGDDAGSTPPPLPEEEGMPGDEWEVTDDDGKVHVFPNEKAANDFYEGLLRQELADEVENAEGWHRNAIEQIGFLESIRRGMVKSGRDTTDQDREIAKWKEERDRLAGEVRRKGGSTDYTALERSDWDFTEEDEMMRRQKEKSDLLRDIHKTGQATRNLANRGNIDYGKGQTDNILERVKEWGDNLASGDGKQPTREELDKLQQILRNEMGASNAREAARNSNWVEEGAQMTSREVFTGRKSDGSTSYKSMVLRGLLGAATAGQSEFAAEVGEKMYVINDEVQKGKSGLEAFGTAVGRAAYDEYVGRLVSGWAKVGGKAARKMGNVAAEGYGEMVKRGHFRGGMIEGASSGAKKVGKFLNQDVGDMMRGGGKEAGEGFGRTAVRPGAEIDPHAPKSDVGGGGKGAELDEAGFRRKEAFERGRSGGREKVNQLDDAIQKHKKAPDSPQAKKDLQDAVDAVQQDKHAMQDMNGRAQDPGSREIREEFNRELQTSYEQAHHTTRQRIADEYGVPVEDVKLLQVTNKPGVGGKIEAADPRGFAQRPKGRMNSHPDAYIQTKPTGKMDVSGTKVSIDQDITYRIRKDNVIDPRTGKASSGYVDVSRADTRRIYDQEFYKARHKGHLPEMRNPDGSVQYHTRGGVEIDDAAVHDYSKKMDQACTDRLDAEAYGNGDADLQTAVKGDYKGRDFDDVEGVGKTMEHKQNEWRNEASDCTDKANRLRSDADQMQSKGDFEGRDRSVREAEGLEARSEGLTEEGYRQTTKQYGNQLEARVNAMNQQRAAAGLPPAQISPKLTEAVDIMKRTGEVGYSPVQVEGKLREIGYTPDKVVQQMSSNLEALQKFKAPVGGSGGFDMGRAAQGGLEGMKKPIGREIFGNESE